MQIVGVVGDHHREALEDLQLEAERAVAGVRNLGFDLAEFGGREAGLTGQRLAVDEGGVERRRHQLVAVLRGDLDEVAEHVVVADLQALDAAIVGVARLHRGHHEARGVAQIAGLVERGLEAFADEAAVALLQRQLVGECAGKSAGQVARRPAQRVHRRRDVGRQVADRAEPRQHLVGGEHAVAKGCEIARAAAADREPRQCARHVGRGLQCRADVVAHAAVGDEHRDRIEPAPDRGSVGERRREPLRQEARSRGGDGAIDGVEQGAAAFAG